VDLHALCDLIVDDLEDALDLPAHETWRYVEPRIAGPEQCPLLVVYAAKTVFELETTTADYTAAHELRIGWGVDATFGAETGLGDPEAAAAAMQVVEQVVERVRGYAAGLPGADDVVVTLVKAEYGIVGGVVWRCEITATIDDLAL